MDKPIVAIDIDEVLFPHVAELTKFYNQRHGQDVKLEDYVSYHFRKVWHREESEVSEVVDAFLALDHRRKVKPLPQAKAVLRRLRKKYRLVVVTSRDKEFEEQAKQWLEHNFPGYFEDVIMAGNEYTGYGYRTKVSVCREAGAVVLVDDHLKYAVECARSGMRALLFGDYPWNQAKRLPAGVERVRDWSEVAKALL